MTVHDSAAVSITIGLYFGASFVTFCTGIALGDIDLRRIALLGRLRRLGLLVTSPQAAKQWQSRLRV